MYWPSIDSQIKDMILKCDTYLSHRCANQQRGPLLQHEIPVGPWQKVATDLFRWNGKGYVLAVDYYSRYFQVAQLNGTKNTTVINNVKAMFARHGIPLKLMSAGGPQYSSSEFADFVQQ